MIDPKRAMSFGLIAGSYSRYRPEVPDAAVDWFLPDASETVVDLAAGTGALTRALVGRVDRIIAVEPDPRMRKVFAENFPEVPVLPGTAESMPLGDGSADAVLMAMAWHWVDPDRAMVEAARVLRPGGTFGVLWNHRDLSVPWVADLDRFSRSARARASRQDGAPEPTRKDVADPPTGSAFTPLQELRLTWSRTMTASELVGYLGTDASAIALPTEARGAVDAEVANYLSDECGLSTDETVAVPMSCRCLRTSRCTGGVAAIASADV